MQALPDYIPQLNDPASNLAAFGAVAVAPPLNPNRREYYAYDGTFIGYGNNCDPISMEPEPSTTTTEPFTPWISPSPEPSPTPRSPPSQKTNSKM